MTIQEQLLEIKENEQINIHYDDKEFIVKRKNNKLKIQAKINFILNFLIRIILFFLSLMIISIAITFISYLIDYIKPFDKTFDDGTVKGYSARGYMYLISEKFWFVFFILAFFITKALSRFVDSKIMEYKFGNAYLDLKKITKTLNQK